METVREPTLCKYERGATAVHCYGCVTIDCCRNESSAGQACKLLKPSKYVRTGALRQTAHLCRTAAGDDDGYDQIPLVNGARPDGIVPKTRSRAPTGTLL